MAAEALRELLQRIAPDHQWDQDSIKIAPLSSGGGNYTSTLFLASASAEGKEDKLFAKVASLGEAMRDNVSGGRIFQVENYIYTKLAKIYASIEEEHKLPEEDRLYFPKFYANSSEQMKETLVLEDLSARGFGSYDRVKSVTWEYARQAVRQMAKWHALSMAYEARQPEEFAEAAEFLQFQSPPVSEQAVEWFQKMLEGVVGAAREDNLPALQRCLPRVMENYPKLFAPKTHPVLAHGDYRVSNLMHRLKDGALDIVPVDYQTVHTGCPASDLVYFIFTGTDRAFRQLHYKNLVEEYYSQLASCLTKLGLDSTTYSRADFDEDLDQVLPCVMNIAIVILPFVLVDESKAPDMSGDYDGVVIKPTTLYAERLNEIIDDLVELGAL